MSSQVRIATRESMLALWQAGHIADALRAAHPGIDITLIPMTTAGDRMLAKPLFEIGGKGLFLKELECALLDDEADIAVHSMKDVPVELPQGLIIKSVLKRLDGRDAFVSNEYDDLDSLPANATVGTSSLRRQCQLKAYRSDICFENLRGNVNTRIKRLDDGEFDAIILASAGLKRLGLEDRIKAHLDTDICLPAIGQGIIGIECRDDDRPTHDLLAPLHDEDTFSLIAAERAFAKKIKADCHLPIAAYAELAESALVLRGRVGMPDGSRLIEGSVTGTLDDPTSAGHALAIDLIDRGAGAILDTVREQLS